jgi:2-alkyl-3-oxoalkanoate reductase
MRRRLPPAAEPTQVNIFVTGAAGLLGSALIAALTQAGHAVIGLVHKDDNIRGNDGKSLGAVLFDGSVPQRGKVQVLRGDIRQTSLGLDKEVCARLNLHVDVVIHCAALVKFETDEAELEAVNVDGTRHVAWLLPNARFIQVSTAYVCGFENGPISEAACNPDGAFGNGYEQAKAKAETVLRAMRRDTVIARPSIIVGEMSTGMIRSFDTIYRVFKFIAEGKIISLPVLPSASLNFVPIDHVVNGICDIVGKLDDVPPFIHLAARKAVPAAHFLTLIGKIPGLCSPFTVDVIPEGTAKVGKAERLAQPYWGYFQRHPEFETQALEQLSGRGAPDMDDVALIRQIRYCVDAGFILADRNGARNYRISG